MSRGGSRLPRRRAPCASGALAAAALVASGLVEVASGVRLASAASQRFFDLADEWHHMPDDGSPDGGGGDPPARRRSWNVELFNFPWGHWQPETAKIVVSPWDLLGAWRRTWQERSGPLLYDPDALGLAARAKLDSKLPEALAFDVFGKLRHPDPARVMASLLGAWRTPSAWALYELEGSRAHLSRTFLFNLHRDDNGTVVCDIVSEIEWSGLSDDAAHHDATADGAAGDAGDAGDAGGGAAAAAEHPPRLMRSVVEGMELMPVYGPEGVRFRGEGMCFNLVKASSTDPGRVCECTFSRRDDALAVELSYEEGGALVKKTMTAPMVS